MRILITGGAGFIGTHLAYRLAKEHSVICLDRKLPKEDFERNIDFVFANCQNKAALVLAAQGVDFIFHLAATVGVTTVLQDPAGCIENNIESLRAVLALGKPGIFASTSEVYGKTSPPLKEDSPLLYSSASRWAYAQSKIVGEHLARAKGWKVVRFFNVVGPGQNMSYGAVLPTFVKQALAGEPLTVFGDGRQKRTFIDVRDVTYTLQKLIHTDFDVVNIGGRTCMDVIGLATTIPRILGVPMNVAYVPYRDAYGEGFEECFSRIPDLSKLNTLVNNPSVVEFEKTVREIATSQKEEHEPLCR